MRKGATSGWRGRNDRRALRKLQVAIAENRKLACGKKS
jgi:hypothetical protein